MAKAEKKRKKAKRKKDKKKSPALSMDPVVSEFCEPRKSGIHQTGVFATKRIPKGARVIEYVGEKLKTKEAEARNVAHSESVEGTDDASVFMFIVDKKHQLDGNVPYNTARFINHSCAANCYPDVIKKRVWIIADREIERGEELAYNYGFDVEHYKEHPCRCGSKKCVGYIVAQEQWGKLRKKIKKAKKKKQKQLREALIPVAPVVPGE